MGKLPGGSGLLSSPPLIRLQDRMPVPYAWEARPAVQSSRWFIFSSICVPRDDSKSSALETGQ